jgi:hypothetical protein
MAQFLAQFTRRSVPRKTTDSLATYEPLQTIEVAGSFVWIQVTMFIFVIACSKLHKSFEDFAREWLR